MGKRACFGIVGVMLMSLGIVLPAAAQEEVLRISTPVSTRATNGSFTVRWDDFDSRKILRGNEGLESLTWYYSPNPDGSDRVRMTSIFREDFRGAGLFQRWTAPGGLNFDWLLKKDRRPYLAGNRNAGPIVLKQLVERDVVVSILVRPTGIRNDFGLGVRWQPNGKGYEIRNVNNQLELGETGQAPLVQQNLLQVIPRNWYWYEISMRTKRNLGVDVRVRVLDEKREKLLLDVDNLQDRPRERSLLGMGMLALWGPADFAEIYVDPWQSRWVDSAQNEFRWDTSVVNDGDYYLVAEVLDARNRPRFVVSDFQIQVRNEARAAAQ